MNYCLFSLRFDISSAPFRDLLSHCDNHAHCYSYLTDMLLLFLSAFGHCSETTALLHLGLRLLVYVYVSKLEP